MWRRRKAPPAIWEGVYERFAEVPSSGAGHASGFWREELTKDVEYARSGEWQEEIVLEHEALLFVLRHAKPARVLDFGGGAGQTYAYVRRAAPELWSAAAAPPLSKAAALPPHSIWTVVELPDVIAHGRTLFAGDDRIAFTDRLVPADLVFVKTALQYIDGWQSTLRELFALGAEHVILEKFSGVSKTYATAQLLGGSAVPYWFIAFDEVFRIAESAGYRRVLWRRLPRVYDQSNFPPERRMGQTSTLVFARS